MHRRVRWIHPAIGAAAPKLAPPIRPDIEDLADLDGRLAPFEFDKEPQGDATCCGELVLAQTEFLALVSNDAAYRGYLVHLALHFPNGNMCFLSLVPRPTFPAREQTSTSLRAPKSDRRSLSR